MDPEAKTVGLSPEGQDRLSRLVEGEHFGRDVDAYRFAISLALAHGADNAPPASNRTTKFNVGTLDPEGSLRFAIETLTDVEGESPYRVAERLAEWGLQELMRLVEEHQRVPFGDLLQEADAMATGAGTIASHLEEDGQSRNGPS